MRKVRKILYAAAGIIRYRPINMALNRITAITPLDFSPISRLRELKLTKLAVLLNTLAQWCTSWCHQLRSWVQTLGINQRGIMCLLVGVLLDVQVPCWEVHQQLIVFGSSFCHCSSSILEPPDHENTRHKSSFVTAIPAVANEGSFESP